MGTPPKKMSPHLDFRYCHICPNNVGFKASLALSLSSLNILILMYLLVPGWIIMNRLFHFRLAWRADNNSFEKFTEIVSSCIEVGVLRKQKVIDLLIDSVNDSTCLCIIIILFFLYLAVSHIY